MNSYSPYPSTSPNPLVNGPEFTVPDVYMSPSVIDSSPMFNDNNIGFSTPNGSSPFLEVSSISPVSSPSPSPYISDIQGIDMENPEAYSNRYVKDHVDFSYLDQTQ